MNKTTYVIALLLTLCLLTSCSANLTDKDRIIKVYSDNEDAFANAAQTGEFADLKRIRGVQKILVWEDYIDIQCGGSGFGSNTHYFGIFYSETDNLVAIDVAGPLEQLKTDGNGYRYKQSGGDNEYYVESLGNHFFYYEAHF